MANERRIRLIQVAKEFNVGINTITDFLQKKGVKSDGSPNALVDAETYALLEKEFGAGRAVNSERVNIRERIAQKQATVTLDDDAKGKGGKNDEELLVKSNVISVKDEVASMGPKILGKIDLSGKGPKAAPAATPAPAPRPAAKPAPTLAPAPAAVPAPAEPVVPTPVEVPEPQPAAPAVTPPAVGKPAPAASAVTPTPAPVRPMASAEAQQKTYDERQAEKKDDIFRPATETLTGPQVLGKIDVSAMVPGGKHRRKRLSKEKVDVNRAQPAGRGGGNGGGSQAGGNASGRGGGQPRPGDGRNKKKGARVVKPVVRPEVSDEEVAKQVKDTLARLTSKGAKSKGAKYRKEKRELVAERLNEEMQREQKERSILKVTEFVTVSELATMMDVSVNEVISACMNLGLMVSINQRLDAEAMVVVAEEFGFQELLWDGGTVDGHIGEGAAPVALGMDAAGDDLLAGAGLPQNEYALTAVSGFPGLVQQVGHPGALPYKILQAVAAVHPGQILVEAPEAGGLVLSWESTFFNRPRLRTVMVPTTPMTRSPSRTGNRLEIQGRPWSSRKRSGRGWPVRSTSSKGESWSSTEICCPTTAAR